MQGTVSTPGSWEWESPEAKTRLEAEGSLKGCGVVRAHSRSRADLPGSHISALEPQPGEHQHQQHVGEGKAEPGHEVDQIFAVREQPERKVTEC